MSFNAGVWLDANSTDDDSDEGTGPQHGAGDFRNPASGSFYLTNDPASGAGQNQIQGFVPDTWLNANADLGQNASPQDGEGEMRNAESAVYYPRDPRTGRPLRSLTPIPLSPYREGALRDSEGGIFHPNGDPTNVPGLNPNRPFLPGAWLQANADSDQEPSRQYAEGDFRNPGSGAFYLIDDPANGSGLNQSQPPTPAAAQPGGQADHAVQQALPWEPADPTPTEWARAADAEGWKPAEEGNEASSGNEVSSGGKPPPHADFLPTVGANLRKGAYDTAAAVADLTGAMATSPGRAAFDSRNQPTLDRLWQEMERLQAKRQLTPEQLWENRRDLLGLGERPFWMTMPQLPGGASEYESRIADDIRYLSNNPGWRGAGQDLRDEGARSYGIYNVDPLAKNFAAQAGRGTAGFLGGVAYMPFGGAGAAAQMGAQTYESRYGDIERSLRDSEDADPLAVHHAAQDGGKDAVVSQAPGILAATIGGRLAAGAVKPLEGYAPQALQPLIRSAAATATNELVGGVQRKLAGGDFLPSSEQLVEDGLWGLYHGYGPMRPEDVPGPEYLNPKNYDWDPSDGTAFYSGSPLPTYKREPYFNLNDTHRDSAPSPKGVNENGVPLQSHHPIQQAWALENLSQYGYHEDLAPTVTLETGRGYAHSVINDRQEARALARVDRGDGKWSSTINEELNYIVRDFRAAGFRNATIKKVLRRQYDMLDELGVKYNRVKGF